VRRENEGVRVPSLGSGGPSLESFLFLLPRSSPRPSPPDLILIPGAVVRRCPFICRRSDPRPSLAFKPVLPYLLSGLPYLQCLQSAHSDTVFVSFFFLSSVCSFLTATCAPAGWQGTFIAIYLNHAVRSRFSFLLYFPFRFFLLLQGLVTGLPPLFFSVGKVAFSCQRPRLVCAPSPLSGRGGGSFPTSSHFWTALQPL